MTQQAAFAAGCFWHVQETFDAIPGIIKTEVGFMGGTTENPSYEAVCRGHTGYAETVLILFDETVLSYEDLVKHFFDLHNPTTLNAQGPDVGHQYRSAIFYFTEEQKNIAETVKKQLQTQLPQPIVTEITAASHFYPAQEYHQKYFAKQCYFSGKPNK